MEDIRLAPNFVLSELSRTEVRRYLDQNRQEAERPPVLDALRALATTLLQPLRNHHGAPVVVHSGYRCPDLNAAVGGSTKSQHRKGEAADFHVVGVALEDVWERIWRNSPLVFGQLILEGHQAGKPTWIHMSLGPPWRPAERSGEVFTFSDGAGYGRVGKVDLVQDGSLWRRA